MSRSIRVQLDKQGVRALANSPGLQEVLNGIAEDIAAAAGEGFDAKPGRRSDRARAVVIATTRKAIRAEERDRALTRAIQAGRRV